MIESLLAAGMAAFLASLPRGTGLAGIVALCLPIISFIVSPMGRSVENAEGMLQLACFSFGWALGTAVFAAFRREADKGVRILCVVGMMVNCTCLALYAEELDVAKDENAAVATVTRLQVLERALCRSDAIPATLEDLVAGIPAYELQYLAGPVDLDGWGNPFHYETNASDGALEGRLVFLGLDGVLSIDDRAFVAPSECETVH